MLGRTSNRKIKSISVILILIISGLLIILNDDQFLPTVDAISFLRQESYDEFLNGTSLNLSIIGSGLDVEIKLRQNATITWTDKSPSTHPPVRHAFGMANFFGTDKVIIFGGNNTTADLEDTWIYDYGENTWTEVITTIKPPERDRCRLVPIWGTKKVILFGGGYFDEGEHLYRNDTWIFDLDSLTWTEKHPISSPEKRVEFGMSFVYGDDKVVLFGGAIPGPVGQFANDTWVYDLSANEWSEKNPKNRPAKRATSKMASIYNDDKVILFSGNNNNLNVIYEDTWVYDLSDNKWVDRKPASQPKGRYRFSIETVYGTDKILLYGGSDGQTDDLSEETWIYDFGANSWVQKYPDPFPSNRAHHELSAISGTNEIILFGCRNRTDPVEQNKTWSAKIELPYEDFGTYISEPLEVSSRSTLKNISWTSELPSGTNINFQLRTAATQLELNQKNFTGPDGTKNTYYTTQSQSVWSGHSGNSWLQYKVYLSTTDNSKTPILKNVTISYNHWSHTILFNPTNGSALTINKPTFHWNFSDSDSAQQIAFQVLIDDNKNFGSIDYDSGEQSSIAESWQFPQGTSYSALSDGTWYWKVRTKDSDGDWGLYSDYFKIIVDTKAPRSNITVPVHNSYLYFLNKIKGTTIDPLPGVGIDKVEISIINQSNGFYWSGSSWSPVVMWLIAEGTTDWTYDSGEVTWQSGCSYGIQARAIDNLNNIEIPQNLTIFTIDLESPKSKVAFPNDGAFLNKVESIYGTAVDINGSGITRVEIQIKNEDTRKTWNSGAWVGTDHYLLTRGTTNWSYDATNVTWATDNNYAITSVSIDNLGFIEGDLTKIRFMFDNKSPENLGITLKNITVTAENYILFLSFSAIDTGSGVHQMSFSEDNITWSAWENYTQIYTFTIPLLMDEYQIYFRVMDSAGNIAEPVNLTLTPEIVGLYIDSDNDSVPDSLDVFPDNTTEWNDTDEDGVGDNSDMFPTDPAASVDSDGDNYPDFWNPGMNELNSTTGLHLDKFPGDPAASLDSDGDKYPDKWNPGKTKKDSTSGLELDYYPDDPNRHVREVVYFEILLFLIVVILLIIIGIVTSILRKRDRKRKLHPFVEDRVLREVRDDIIDGKISMATSLILEKDRIRLQEMYERGEISESAYEIIKEFKIVPEE